MTSATRLRRLSRRDARQRESALGLEPGLAPAPKYSTACASETALSSVQGPWSASPFLHGGLPSAYRRESLAHGTRWRAGEPDDRDARQKAERAAGVRSPRVGRFTHARREASLRVDDSSFRR